MELASASTNLIQEAASVFDLCADEYLETDSHWGDDVSTLSSLIEGRQRAIDIGCGPGWHLNWLAEHSGVSDIVGVDYSDRMLELARCRISKYQSRVTLLSADMRRVPLPSATFDLLLCLNNTLGNLCVEEFGSASSARRAATLEFFRLLKPSGVMVVSVYNRRRLRSDAPYGQVFQLEKSVSNERSGDYVVRYLEPGRTPAGGLRYYSHWFTPEELTELASSSGFAIENVCEVDSRIVLVGRRTV